MKIKEFARAILIVIGMAFFDSCENEGSFVLWDSHETVIGIQPFGDIKEKEIDSVYSALTQMYSMKVEILEPIPLPKNAYTEIRYPRYRADTLVQWLTDQRPDSIDIYVGLTNKDISITKYKAMMLIPVSIAGLKYFMFGWFKDFKNPK